MPLNRFLGKTVDERNGILNEYNQALMPQLRERLNEMSEEDWDNSVSRQNLLDVMMTLYLQLTVMVLVVEVHILMNVICVLVGHQM